MGRRKESILVIGAFIAITIVISLGVVKLGAFITCLMTVVMPLLAILVYRYPLFFVYTYLIVTPFDAFPLMEGYLSLSMADLLAIALVGLCALRPLCLLNPPSWFIACTVGLLIAFGTSALISGSPASMVALRGIVGKILAAYIVACFVVESGEIRKAILMCCIGIFASVALGIVQEIIYMWEGWLAMLWWAPPESIIAPTRFLNILFPIRVPGGTAHAAELGVIITFPAGIVIGRLMTRKGKSLFTIILMAGGLIGFFITESRALILGLLGLTIVLLLSRAIESRSELKMASLFFILSLVTTISTFFLLQFGAGERIEVVAEMMELGSQLLIGLGPAMFDLTSPLEINVHSTPFQILTDAGLLGIIAYLFLVGKTTAVLWKHRKENPVLFWIFGGFLGVFIPALTVHPLIGSRSHWVFLALAAATYRVHYLSMGSIRHHSIVPSIYIRKRQNHNLC